MARKSCRACTLLQPPVALTSLIPRWCDQDDWTNTSTAVFPILPNASRQVSHLFLTCFGQILEVYARQLSCCNDIEWSELAEETVDWTGADLQALLANANLEAIHDVLDQEQEVTREKDASDDGVPEIDFVAHGVGEDVKELEKRLAVIMGREESALKAELKRPVVTHEHLQVALEDFRPSLTPSERRRHELIRKRFLSGRSEPAGELVTIA
jgi:hypothetical protein